MMIEPMVILMVLFKGLGITLLLTLTATSLALPLAFAAGLARVSTYRPSRAVATVYIELFRGTSALVQLFWFYFVLPLFGLNLPAFLVGTLVLGLNAGAYGAEIVRASLLAIPRSQRDGALALHFSPAQALFRIYIPQALPAMIPPFGNILVELLKNTALASLITMTELTFSAQLLRAQLLHSTLIFTLVLLMYFGSAQAILYLVKRLEQRIPIKREMPKHQWGPPT